MPSALVADLNLRGSTPPSPRLALSSSSLSTATRPWRRPTDTEVVLDLNLQLVFEGINLNNEKYYVYQGTKPYNMQHEQYGRTYKLSLKANLF